MGLWIQSILSNAHSTMAYVLKLGLTTAQLVFSPKDSALDITRCCSSGCNEAPPEIKMRSCLAHGFHLKQQVWYGSNIIYHIICSRPDGVVICYWWCCRLYHSQICATAHGLRIALTPPHHTHTLSNRGFPIRSISTVVIFSRLVGNGLGLRLGFGLWRVLGCWISIYIYTHQKMYEYIGFESRWYIYISIYI